MSAATTAAAANGQARLRAGAPTVPARWITRIETFLNGQGLVRGHFHTACRILRNTGEAPDSSEVPAFFVATEDGGGGARPDTVTVRIPGLPAAGEAQCATWAGDGSHRMPMMVFANQVPAFDAVRITVRGAGAAAAEPAEAPGQAPDAGTGTPAAGTGEAAATAVMPRPTTSASNTPTCCCPRRPGARRKGP